MEAIKALVMKMVKAMLNNSTCCVNVLNFDTRCGIL